MFAENEINKRIRSTTRGLFSHIHKLWNVDCAPTKLTKIQWSHISRFSVLGCQMLIYPAAFNMTTGPLHWSLLQRSRANDNQLYVACISPARVPSASYVAWGHTQLTNPWGKILYDLETQENMVVTDIGNFQLNIKSEKSMM